MNLKKMNSLLQFALKFPSIVSEDAFTLITGQKISEQSWDILMRYYNNLDSLEEDFNLTYQKISDEYALIRIDKNLIGDLSNRQEVIYLELPMVMNYILDQSLFDVCVTGKTVSQQGFDLSGEGVLVGVVDSGIDYFHTDFRNEDGTTRIISLWDQGGSGNPPTGFTQGSVYSSEQINEALQAPTRAEGLEIVPQVDELGHGTAITGIAAGNGRALNGKYTGVAPEADLVVVKVNNPNISPEEGTLLPRNVDIMMGINYILEEARKRRQPVSLLIGFGLNEGTHDGKNSMERFIDEASVIWRNNIVVGSGNQANKDNHTSGVLQEGEEKDITIFIDSNQPYYLLVMVKNFIDTFGIQLISPTGEKTEVLTSRIPNRGYIFGNTGVMINFSGPDPNTSTQQLTILLEKFEGSDVNPGIWTLKLIGEEVVLGDYHIWASSLDPFARVTRFLQPNPAMTVTIPSTAERVTTVGALNQTTEQILPFSGRGYTLDQRVKPDIVAPGNNIMTPTSLEPDGYAPVTGTSAAAAFMAGGYALLLEYGVREKPDNYIYGEELRATVIKHAKRPPQYAPYPNPRWGYGILCIDEVLDALKEQYDA